MKLVIAEQMQRIDRGAIDGHGIPSLELMENAGRGIAQRMEAFVRPGMKVVVFCGKGNNGGDGFVVGRYLHDNDVAVEIFHLGAPDDLSDDSRANYTIATEHDIPITQLEDLSALPQTLDCDFIVDAIFGTGFSGAPRGLSGELIDYINRQPARIVAVDMPSGLNADSGRAEGTVIRAHHTFTLALPKFGLYVSPGRELSGAIDIVPIGIPDEVVDGFDLSVDLTTIGDIRSCLPLRPSDGHKGTFGKVLIVAGSLGMTGAAILSGKSAYRCGVGLVKIGCPREVLPIIASSFVEATTHPLPDVAKKGALAVRSLGEIREMAKEHDALAIGPGIGRHRETFELVRRLVPSIDKPMVIDADGLNAFEGHTDILKDSSKRGPIVLTPHPGEFKRLSGTMPPDNIFDKIAVARRFAADHNVTLLLKGSPTVIADSSGSCWLNPTGNAGMGCGGTGDVLTGIIGSLLAQGVTPIRAAVAGAFIHGMAGDLTADELTGRAMMAGDMIDFLCDVFEIVGD